MGAHYKIRAEKTGHFFMQGTITEQTRFVWICLHGYGGLAKYFIRHFEFLDPVQNLVIVPEGLNRYYSDEIHVRTAANWMTREDRLDEIADYILFLESLRSKLGWDKNQDIKVIYLGFSQGVATLIRWLATIKPRVDHLIMWAGTIPDDLFYENLRSYFEKIDAHFFLGDQDEYVKQINIPGAMSLIEQSGIHAEIHNYQGNHRIDGEILNRFYSDVLLK